jgi:spore germination protein YaaH
MPGIDGHPLVDLLREVDELHQPAFRTLVRAQPLRGFDRRRCSESSRPIGGRRHATGGEGPYTPVSGPSPTRSPRLLPSPLRSILPLLAALAFALAASLALAAPGNAATKKKASVCKTASPAKVTFTRARGQSYGWLRWTKPKQKLHGKVRYRVTVNGKRRTATTARRLKVRVKPAQKLSFKVATTRAPKCARALKTTATFYAPTTPQNVGAAQLSETAVRLSWLAARKGDGKLAGYRITRNGATYRQVAATTADVAVAAGVQSTLTVAAVDTQGHVSAASAPVTVGLATRAPGAPAGLVATTVSDSSIGLSWSAGAPGTGRVVGYRVYRNGTLLGQVAGTTYVAGNLAPNQAYTFTVQAVDSRSLVSDPSAPAAARTAAPVPTTGSAHAYLLATTDQSFRDFQAHYRNIGVVHPTYFECNRATSAIQGADDPLVTQWAQARKVKVLARYDCQDGTAIDRILNDPATRAATLDGLTGLVARYGYDGISIDFEAGAASNRAALTSFMTELGRRLHAAGRLLSMAVSPKASDSPTHPRGGIFDYAALVPNVDWMFVMNWGIHWMTSAPGPMADLTWATPNANYVASMPQKKKWILGAPMYGFDWPGDGGSDEPATPLEYTDVQALIARVGATPRFDTTSGEWTFTYHSNADGKTHTVWYVDSRAIAPKFALARDRGLGGVGVWHLGSEDPSIWDQAAVAPGAVW